MNQPDRYHGFILQEGVQRVAYVRDAKLPDAGTFTLMNEDHT